MDNNQLTLSNQLTQSINSTVRICHNCRRIEEPVIVCFNCKHPFCQECSNHAEWFKQCDGCNKLLCENCYPPCANCKLIHCLNCTEECNSCHLKLCCNACNKKQCSICNDRLCKKCGVPCTLCSTLLCKKHLIGCSKCDKYYCDFCCNLRNTGKTMCLQCDPSADNIVRRGKANIDDNNSQSDKPDVTYVGKGKKKRLPQCIACNKYREITMGEFTQHGFICEPCVNTDPLYSNYRTTSNNSKNITADYVNCTQCDRIIDTSGKGYSIIDNVLYVCNVCCPQQDTVQPTQVSNNNVLDVINKSSDKLIDTSKLYNDPFINSCMHYTIDEKPTVVKDGKNDYDDSKPPYQTNLTCKICRSAYKIGMSNEYYACDVCIRSSSVTDKYIQCHACTVTSTFDKMILTGKYLGNDKFLCTNCKDNPIKKVVIVPVCNLQKQWNDAINVDKKVDIAPICNSQKQENETINVIVDKFSEFVCVRCNKYVHMALGQHTGIGFICSKCANKDENENNYNGKIVPYQTKLTCRSCYTTFKDGMSNEYYICDVCIRGIIIMKTPAQCCSCCNTTTLDKLISTGKYLGNDKFICVNCINKPLNCFACNKQWTYVDIIKCRMCNRHTCKECLNKYTCGKCQNECAKTNLTNVCVSCCCFSSSSVELHTGKKYCIKCCNVML